MLKFNHFLTEGSDLHCGNCGDNLGKATENSKKAHCGNCGHKTNNPRGHEEHSAPPKPSLASHEMPKIGMSAHKSANPSGKHFKVAKNDNAKQVDHGDGYYSQTFKYNHHGEYGKKHDDFSHSFGVKEARTTIHHKDATGWVKEIGHIHHVKHHDGEETHTLYMSPSNAKYPAGAAKNLKHAVQRVKDTHEAFMKKTGYYDKRAHNHGVKFVKDN